MAENRLTPAALDDLEGIWRYTATRWGMKQAGHYLDLIHSAFEAIAQAPGAAPACNHIRAGYRRVWVEHHAIDYRAEVDDVIVVRVLHERMDVARHL